MNHGWGKKLRELRARSSLKQQTLASLLKVSQGYVSRLEADSVIPDEHVAERIRRLLASPEHLPFVEQVAIAVRLSPHMVCLTDDTLPLSVIASSCGTDATPSPFIACEGKAAVDNPALVEFCQGLAELSTLRRSNGGTISAGHVWRSVPETAEHHLKSVHIPLKVSAGRWVWHSTSVFISRSDFEGTARKWGGHLLTEPGALP
tara:strand:- start:5117 stop:5728 length:612 start_codon:yes stop_codon:yes gene_type:complete